METFAVFFSKVIGGRAGLWIRRVVSLGIKLFDFFLIYDDFYGQYGKKEFMDLLFQSYQRGGAKK